MNTKKLPKIVLFGGFAQHGKDTSASIFKEYMSQRGKKCLIVRNGDYLKFVAKEYYGWDGEKDVKGRTLLQTLGTEKARDNNPDVWVNVLIELVKAIGSDFDYVLIPDFRYPNEHIRFVKEGYDTHVVWVYRTDFDNGLTAEQKNHRSETSLLNYSFDTIIKVESKVEKLVDKIHLMIEVHNL
jgi:hypothetical protein